jgi:hypothetical protein
VIAIENVRLFDEIQDKRRRLPVSKSGNQNSQQPFPTHFQQAGSSAGAPNGFKSEGIRSWCDVRLMFTDLDPANYR